MNRLSFGRALAAMCLLSFAATTTHAQSDRVAWIRANAVAFSDASSDADLAAIGRALEGAEVVFLGESSHGDGGGHLARVRLVRYLHERLGFDVMAWEAGVREAATFDSALATSASLGTIAPIALYPWWAESAELRPMLGYMRATRRTNKPLTFAGFDIQRSGPLDSLVSYLTRSFDRANQGAIVPAAVRDSLTRGLTRLAALSGGARDTLEDALERTLHAAAPDIARAFESARPSLARTLGAREVDVLGRVVTNVSAHAEQLRLAREPDQSRRAAASLASYNLREQRNAENILWLRRLYPGRKLIVWLHNVHAINARFAPRFDGIVLDRSDGVRESTARVVKDSLGARSYAVAMVSYDGAWAFPGGQRTELPPAPSGSLAAMLHETGASRAFLDLRGTRQLLPAWLNEPMTGTANTQTATRYPVVWPRIADGVLFIDRMTPSTRATP